MKKLIGVFASVALLGSGVAMAQDSMTKDSQQPSTSAPAQGGSGQTGSDSSMQGSSGSSDAMGGSGSSSTHSSSMAGENELTGKVVKSDSKKVYVSSASGAVVPLDIDSKTQFTDPSLRNAKSLKEGQEIRASFQVKDEKNMAINIAPSQGMGGSGSDAMSPDSSMNQGSKGTGQDNGSSTHDSSSSPKTY